MAIFTGNSSAVTFTGYNEWDTAVLTNSIDPGTQTRPALPYSPLNSPLEKMHPGDTASARVYTFIGLYDITAPQTNGPNIEDKTVRTMINTYVNGVTYTDDGFFLSMQGPVQVNNQILEVTVEYQLNNIGATRGWAPATPPT